MEGEIMRTARFLGTSFFITIAIALAAGCGSSSNTTGTGGSGGGTGGASGGSGGGSGGSSGADASAGGDGGVVFKSVAPCLAESDYKAGKTVTFPITASNGFRYDPQCLKVSAGSSVTFNGDFAAHPLNPSAHRPNPDTPITSTSSGTSTSFTFTKPGFYAYYCAFHDPLDSGMLMSGVVWVTP
jgi:plastocyanin